MFRFSIKRKESGETRMIPTKTSFQIADELDDIDEDEKCSYEDWAKEGEKKWVSVDVLRQVFKKAEVICYAANGDEIIMYDPKILKEVLVGLEPEEAKKS